MKRLPYILIALFLLAAVFFITRPPKDITLEELMPAAAPLESTVTAVGNNVQPATSVEVPEEKSADTVKPSPAAAKIPEKVPAKPEKPAAKPAASPGNETTTVKNTSEPPAQSGTTTYYIIIQSTKNLAQAQQTAQKLKADLNADIIALPPTKEGYCRISYGKYSTREEALSVIEKVKARLGSGPWLYADSKKTTP